MPCRRIAFTYHHYDNVLAKPDVREPPRKQSCTREAGTHPDLIGIPKGLLNTCPVLRQQVRVSLGNVQFPFFSQFHLTLEVWTLKETHPAILAENLASNAPNGKAHRRGRTE